MRRIAWTEQARADVRGLDKLTAKRILSALHRFAAIKTLQGDAEELRLRVGDFRLFFVSTADDVIEVRRVRHRREAHRSLVPLGDSVARASEVRSAGTGSRAAVYWADALLERH